MSDDDDDDDGPVTPERLREFHATFQEMIAAGILVWNGEYRPGHDGKPQRVYVLKEFMN